MKAAVGGVQSCPMESLPHPESRHTVLTKLETNQYVLRVPRGGKSAVWKIFLHVTNLHEHKIDFVLCRYCCGLFMYKGYASGTSSLMNHGIRCLDRPKKVVESNVEDKNVSNYNGNNIANNNGLINLVINNSINGSNTHNNNNNVVPINEDWPEAFKSRPYFTLNYLKRYKTGDRRSPSPVPTPLQYSLAFKVETGGSNGGMVTDSPGYSPLVESASSGGLKDVGGSGGLGCGAVATAGTISVGGTKLLPPSYNNNHLQKQHQQLVDSKPNIIVNHQYQHLQHQHHHMLSDGSSGDEMTPTGSQPNHLLPSVKAGLNGGVKHTAAAASINKLPNHNKLEQQQQQLQQQIQQQLQQLQDQHHQSFDTNQPLLHQFYTALHLAAHNFGIPVETLLKFTDSLASGGGLQRSLLQQDDGSDSASGGLSGLEAVVAAAAAAAAAENTNTAHNTPGAASVGLTSPSQPATVHQQVPLQPQPHQLLQQQMMGSSSMNKPESYQLRHNNHLSLVLTQLAEDESFMDVTLTAEGNPVKAHKSVLSAVSPYFSTVLKANPCQHPIIIMPRDIKYSELSNIIMYIYRGEMTVSAEDLPSLLKTAELLRITGLSPSEASDNTATNSPNKTPNNSNSTISAMQHQNTNNAAAASDQCPSSAFRATLNSNCNITSRYNTTSSTPNSITISTSKSTNNAHGSSSSSSTPSSANGSCAHDNSSTAKAMMQENSFTEKSPSLSMESPTHEQNMINPSDFMDIDMTCVKEEMNSDDDQNDTDSSESTSKEVTTPPPIENPLSSSRKTNSPDRNTNNLSRTGTNSSKNASITNSNPGTTSNIPSDPSHLLTGFETTSRSSPIARSKNSTVTSKDSPSSSCSPYDGDKRNASSTSSHTSDVCMETYSDSEEQNKEDQETSDAVRKQNSLKTLAELAGIDTSTNLSTSSSDSSQSTSVLVTSAIGLTTRSAAKASTTRSSLAINKSENSVVTSAISPASSPTCVPTANSPTDESLSNLPNICPYCSEYIVGSTVRSHMSTKHAFKPAFICETCGRIYTRKTVFENHSKSCTTDK